jgi:hypothetical protein
MREQMVKGLSAPSESYGYSNGNKKNQSDLKIEDNVPKEDTGTMSHEDIDNWSKMFNLSGEQIFQLDAEFESLIIVEKQERERMKLKKAGKLKDELFEQQEDVGALERFEAAKKYGDESENPSIPLWVFLKYTKSLADKFK